LHFPDAEAGPERIEAFGNSLVRLVDRDHPDESLLLKKPTMRISHTGGLRIKPGSAEEVVLKAWIFQTPDICGQKGRRNVLKTRAFSMYAVPSTPIFHRIKNGRVVRARMRIDHAYKGVSEPELILFDDGMCGGPDLQVGEQYLMYTRRFGEGDVPSRGCTRSRHVKFAEEDFKYLEGFKEAAPTAIVFGRVVTWPDGPGDNLPVPGAVVKLQGPKEALTTAADNDGRYSFDSLKAGKYSVSASQSGFRSCPLYQDLNSAAVEARGCAVIDVTLFKDWPGTIAGRLIRPDNTPAAAGIDLTLIRMVGSGDDE
jgi:hypothetical protein